MFGKRTTDFSESRTASAATAGAPLVGTSGAEAGTARSFGRRKDDATIRFTPPSAPAGGSPPQAGPQPQGSAAAPPLLVSRLAQAPAAPSLSAQRSHIEAIKDRIH